MIKYLRTLLNNENSKAINNSTWLIMEKIISMGLSLFTGILIARYMGVELFGLYSYLLALTSLMGPLCVMGLKGIITKELIETPSKANTILGTAFIIRLLGGVGALGIIVLSSIWLLDTPNERILLVILAIAQIFIAAELATTWFEYRVEIQPIVKMRISLFFLSAILKISAVFLSLSLFTFVVITAAEVAFRGIFALILLQKKSRLVFRLKFSQSYAMKFAKNGFWLVLSGFAAIIYLKIDQIMLGNMVSNSAVGQYAVASRFSEIWYFIPIAITTSFFPKLLTARKKSQAIYTRQLQNLCDVLLLLALIVAILMTFLSNWFIPFIFGEEYSPAGNILAIHIWAGLFVFMRALLSKWLIAEGLYSMSLLTHGVGAIINILLNYFLIPLWQGEGAAIATIISYASAGYFSLFFHSSTRPMAIIMTRSLIFPFHWLKKI